MTDSLVKQTIELGPFLQVGDHAVHFPSSFKLPRGSGEALRVRRVHYDPSPFGKECPRGTEPDTLARGRDEHSSTGETGGERHGSTYRSGLKDQGFMKGARVR